MSNAFLAVFYGSPADFAQLYLCLAVFILIQDLYIGSLAYRALAPAMGYQCADPLAPVRF
jgi:hypothetical protein